MKLLEFTPLFPVLKKRPPPPCHDTFMFSIFRVHVYDLGPPDSRSCLDSTVGEQENEKRVLKLFARPSQGHKYVVSAEVLHNSWLMDGSELTFVQKLSESRRNETRGRVKNTTQSLTATPRFHDVLF